MSDEGFIKYLKDFMIDFYNSNDKKISDNDLIEIFKTEEKKYFNNDETTFIDVDERGIDKKLKDLEKIFKFLKSCMEINLQENDFIYIFEALISYKNCTNIEEEKFISTFVEFFKKSMDIRDFDRLFYEMEKFFEIIEAQKYFNKNNSLERFERLIFCFGRENKIGEIDLYSLTDIFNKLYSSKITIAKNYLEDKDNFARFLKFMLNYTDETVELKGIGYFLSEISDIAYHQKNVKDLKYILDLLLKKKITNFTGLDLIDIVFYFSTKELQLPERLAKNKILPGNAYSRKLLAENTLKTFMTGLFEQSLSVKMTSQKEIEEYVKDNNFWGTGTETKSEKDLDKLSRGINLASSLISVTKKLNLNEVVTFLLKATGNSQLIETYEQALREIEEKLKQNNDNFAKIEAPGAKTKASGKEIVLKNNESLARFITDDSRQKKISIGEYQIPEAFCKAFFNTTKNYINIHENSNKERIITMLEGLKKFLESELCNYRKNNPKERTR